PQRAPPDNLRGRFSTRSWPWPSSCSNGASARRSAPAPGGLEVPAAQAAGLGAVSARSAALHAASARAAGAGLAGGIGAAAGIALLLVMEAGVPVPVPADLVMLAVGARV